MITFELNLFHLTFVDFSCCALDFLYLIKLKLIKKILKFEQIGKIKELITINGHKSVAIQPCKLNAFLIFLALTAKYFSKMAN